MIATVIATRAFQEGGFAVTFDDFGGGYNKPNILKIMKDSRIGTYGIISLIFILALKFFLLIDIPTPMAYLKLLTVIAIRRFSALTVMYTYDYAHENDTISKSKPLAKSMTTAKLLPGLILGILPLFLMGLEYTVSATPAVLVTRFLRLLHYLTCRVHRQQPWYNSTNN